MSTTHSEPDKAGTSEPLAPFDPPYFFGGSALIVVGTLRAAELPVLPGRFRMLAPFGRLLAVLILTDYREPPVELPLRYRELILARFVRRGLCLASQPVDMALDAELPVTLGIRHYDLPKRYDATLRVDLEATQGSCHGHDIRLAWREPGPWLQRFAFLWRLLCSVAIALSTRGLDVLGAGVAPKRTQIALTPRTLGRLLHVSSVRMGALSFQPLFALRFMDVRTRLGEPRAF